MGTRFEFVSFSDIDSRIDIVTQEASLLQWRADENDEQEDGVWIQMLERLNFLFEFVATNNQSKAIGMRMWCVLYAVRPDLVNNETIQVAADRFEVSQQRLCQLLDEMKKRTGITYRSKVGIADPVKARKAIDAMSRARSEKAKRFALRIGGQS